jgi:hypothetical protein
MMSNFKGLSPRSSSDDPEKYKAGFVTYQGHEALSHVADSMSEKFRVSKDG